MNVHTIWFSRAKCLMDFEETPKMRKVLSLPILEPRRTRESSTIRMVLSKAANARLPITAALSLVAMGAPATKRRWLGVDSKMCRPRARAAASNRAIASRPSSVVCAMSAYRMDAAGMSRELHVSSGHSGSFIFSGMTLTTVPVIAWLTGCFWTALSMASVARFRSCDSLFVEKKLWRWRRDDSQTVSSDMAIKKNWIAPDPSRLRISSARPPALSTNITITSTMAGRNCSPLDPPPIITNPAAVTQFRM
mmetsp:Transcript_21633/g.50928  ORF Transcript_21633/g.50928 Transcript_21633/m.50928 type:complete len:250 (-) Transcript_21633:2429-3178(-)